MSPEYLRIASYNIRKARGLDNRRMPERTLEVINGLDADIVVLQEADRRLGSRRPAISRAMIAAETDFELIEVSQNNVSLGWHGNAILMRAKAKATHFERITLPGLEPRGAVRVSLDINDGLCIVATHLGLRRRDRRMQLEVLRNATRNSAHAVLAGDFNEWSTRKGMEPLHGRFEVHAPGRSFHARRPTVALDRFAVSTDLRFASGGVDQSALARRASDHLPVWADVLVPLAHSTC